MPRLTDHRAAVEALCSVNAAYASNPEEQRAELRDTISVLADAIIEADFVRNTAITEVADLDALPVGSLIFVPSANPMRGNVLIRHPDDWWHIDPSTGEPRPSEFIVRVAHGNTVTVLREGLPFV